MPLSLPRPIAAYFAADATDGAALARCFAADAEVIDERQTHRGREAIARWKAEAATAYDYVSEPVAVDDQGNRIIVTTHLTGNFPGSPVDLLYAFTLAGNEIVRLEIVP
jgi:SnoaL-like domain